MTTGQAGWVLEWRWSTAAALHGPWPPEHRLHRRSVAVCSVTGNPALVLGSAQPDTVADAQRLAANAVTLVRRRSGGGAVLVEPHAQVWLDAWIPRHDPLWDDDIVRGASWLGDVWAAALGALGVTGVSVHRGRALRTAWSDTVCFSGLGPGEVSVHGRKVVGVAQRRTRHGARLHSMAHLVWDPSSLAVLLALSEPDRARAVAETASMATGLADVLARGPAGTAGSAVGGIELVGSTGGVGARHAVEEALLAELPQVDRARAG